MTDTEMQLASELMTLYVVAVISDVDPADTLQLQFDMDTYACPCV